MDNKIIEIIKDGSNKYKSLRNRNQIVTTERLGQGLRTQQMRINKTDIEKRFK